MPRPRRTVAALCIAVVAFAAFLPGVWSLGPVSFEPVWVLEVADTPGPVVPSLVGTAAQLLALRSTLASRGPPSALAS